MKETCGSIRKVLCGCKRPVELSEISVWGVREPWRYPKFCVNERGSKCKPKSYVARDENTRTWLSRRLRVE